VILSATEAVALAPDLADVDTDVLELKLAAVEMTVRGFTNNPFTVTNATVTAPIEDGRVFGRHGAIRQGDTVVVSRSQLDDGLYTVEEVTAVSTVLDRVLMGHGKLRMTLVRYPADVRAGALELLRWDALNRGKQTKKAETLSRHRVEYATPTDEAMKSGYPADLLAFLRPYRKARF